MYRPSDSIYKKQLFVSARSAFSAISFLVPERFRTEVVDRVYITSPRLLSS